MCYFSQHYTIYCVFVKRNIAIYGMITYKYTGSRTATRTKLLDITYSCLTHFNLNAFDKSRLFVIATQTINRIDDLSDFLQGLVVHDSVELLKFGFDGYVVHTIRTGRKCQQPMM